MSIFKNKSVKKLIIVAIILIIVFACCFSLITLKQYSEYTDITNKTITRLIENVRNNETQEIDEVAIVRILNNENIQDEKILQKYGYEDDVTYIKELKQNMKNGIILNIFIIVSLGLAFLSLFIVYLYRRENKIKVINDYLKKLNNHNYELNITDNDEAELSKLRNELYKTTILLKETAEISKREKEQLSNSLADISHQLKTPLTSIRIMLDNLEDNPNMEKETREEFTREISKQIDWISSLVISLLKIAKFDSGTIKMKREEINVKELIDKIIEKLSILLEIKGISIICNIPENIRFCGDFKWQLEAFTNIIKNAIEHSDENSNIYIEVENTNLFLKIKIIDEGEGIEKEELKHIFERFYKAKKANDTSVGIGLPLAKTIIEGNNGYISVDSKISEGTTFEIKYMKIE